MVPVTHPRPGREKEQPEPPPHASCESAFVSRFFPRGLEVTGHWLREAVPERMVWKARVFYSERAAGVPGHCRCPGGGQVTVTQARDAAEGTPQGTSVWATWPLTFNSKMPWAYESLSLLRPPSGSLLRTLWEAKAFVPPYVGQDLTTPGPLGVTGTNWTSLPSPPITDESRFPSWHGAIANWFSPPDS